MRNGINVLAAILIAAGAAACGGDDDVELYEGEEAATPSLDANTTQPATDAAVITAQFEAPEDAPEAGQQVTGTLRVLEARRSANAAAPTTDGAKDPTTDAATDGTTDAANPNMSVSSAGAGQEFRLEASLDGLSQGDHAWHIHSGPCGEEAPVVVALSRTADMQGLTQSLNADGSGHAEGTATVPVDELSLDQLRSGEYSVHVHAQGGVDHGPTVACADLNDEGGFGA